MGKWSANQFIPVHTLVNDTMVDGIRAVRVVKKDKVELPDENTYAACQKITLRNGVIQMRLRSRLLPNAPEYARGFVGLVFRAKADGSEFESFYLRPTNGRNCMDPVRRAHGCQYFSYPGYTFRYFREFGITAYEAPVDIALDEWFTLKAVIREEHSDFYINGQKVLAVPHLKHGCGEKGMLGIYVDIGTEAFLSDMEIHPED